MTYKAIIHSEHFATTSISLGAHVFMIHSCPTIERTSGTQNTDFNPAIAHSGEILVCFKVDCVIAAETIFFFICCEPRRQDKII